MGGPPAGGDSAKKLGLTFRDPELLARALTHPSWSEEHGGGDYERLEFLGDSVLGLVVAEYLHERFPESPEGELSRMKSALVRTRSLASAARSLGVAAHIRVGRGAEQGGERERASVLEAVFEALVAAIYLDGGADAARAFIIRALGEQLESANLLEDFGDAKGELQELTQGRGLALPAYRITGREGPVHAPCFAAEVEVDGVVAGQGSGRSKQAAEQAAAAQALNTLRRSR